MTYLWPAMTYRLILWPLYDLAILTRERAMTCYDPSMTLRFLPVKELWPAMTHLWPCDSYPWKSYNLSMTLRFLPAKELWSIYDLANLTRERSMTYLWPVYQDIWKGTGDPPSRGGHHALNLSVKIDQFASCWRFSLVVLLSFPKQHLPETFKIYVSCHYFLLLSKGKHSFFHFFTRFSIFCKNRATFRKTSLGICVFKTSICFIFGVFAWPGDIKNFKFQQKTEKKHVKRAQLYRGFEKSKKLEKSIKVNTALVFGTESGKISVSPNSRLIAAIRTVVFLVFTEIHT